MRLSILQLARLRGWEDTTIHLIELAIADTPGCALDFDTERDIDLPWFQEFHPLRPALDRLLLDQFDVDLRQARHGPPKVPLTALQRLSAPHVLEYIEALSVSMKAAHDSLEREIHQELAVHEAEQLLDRIQKKGFPSGRDPGYAFGVPLSGLLECVAARSTAAIVVFSPGVPS